MTKGTTSSALNGLARLAANSKACSELDEKSTGTTMRLNFIAHLLDARQSKTRAAGRKPYRRPNRVPGRVPFSALGIAGRCAFAHLETGATVSMPVLGDPSSPWGRGADRGRLGIAPAVQHADVVGARERLRVGATVQIHAAAHVSERIVGVLFEPFGHRLAHGAQMPWAMPQQCGDHLHRMGTRHDRLDRVERRVDGAPP